MKTLSVVVASVLLSSCGSTAPFSIREYRVGEVRMASVGSVMCGWEYGTKRKIGGVEAKDGVRKELIYNGVSDSTIFVAYREYFFDMNYSAARPAFANELKYSLRSQQLITYQEMQLEVLEATSQYIKFRVVKDLGRPQLAGQVQQPQPSLPSTMPAAATAKDRYPVRLTTRGGSTFRYFYVGETETTYLLVLERDSQDVMRVSKASVQAIERAQW